METIDCNRTDLHERLGKGRLTHVKQFRHSCYRATCRSCYTNWIARQANASTRRIESYFEKLKQRPIHPIIPPDKHFEGAVDGKCGTLSGRV